MPLTKESSDKDILDYPIAGNTTVRELGSISFIGWVANKLNNAPAYKAATQELLALVKSPPLGRLPEPEKIRVVRKILEIGIEV